MGSDFTGWSQSNTFPYKPNVAGPLVWSLLLLNAWHSLHNVITGKNPTFVFLTFNIARWTSKQHQGTGKWTYKSETLTSTSSADTGCISNTLCLPTWSKRGIKECKWKHFLSVLWRKKTPILFCFIQNKKCIIWYHGNSFPLNVFHSTRASDLLVALSGLKTVTFLTSLCTCSHFQGRKKFKHKLVTTDFSHQGNNLLLRQVIRAQGEAAFLPTQPCIWDVATRPSIPAQNGTICSGNLCSHFQVQEKQAQTCNLDK